MNFTLITSSGSVMTFYIERTARVYQTLYGGVIITSAIVEPVTAYRSGPG